MAWRSRGRAAGYGPGGYGPGGYGPGGSGDIRPIPDPTRLTTEAMQDILVLMRREVAALERILDEKLTGIRMGLEARLDAMDQATGLLRVIADRVPSEVDNKIAQLHALYDEKFHGIHGQLVERQRWIEEKFNDRRTAVEAAFVAERDARHAALMAAKDALAKAELATEKRFESVNEFRATLSDQARELMPRNEAQTLINALSTKLNDLNDRLNRREGTGSGMEKSWAALIAVVGIVIALGALYVKSQ